MKSFGYDITPNVIQYNSSIRSKATIAQLLIEVARFLLLSKPQSDSELPVDIPVGKIRLIVYIDKMSRVFIEEHTKKIHSFLFPLILKADENGFILSHNGYRLSNATCTIMSAVFSDQEEDESIERILEKYWDIAADFSIPREEYEQYAELITHLLSFEVGYLRFDYDESQADEKYHPKSHLDINYTGRATYKIGLRKTITCQEMIRLINICAPCSYLEDLK